MKHVAATTQRLSILTRGAFALAMAAFLVIPFVAVAGPAQQAQAAESGSAVTVSGSGAFSSVKISVAQTQDLVNQAVKVTWSGAAPSLVSGAGVVLGNYMQLMQCWAEPGQQPTREQCQFGGFVDVPDGSGNIASRQMTQPVKDPNETTYVNGPGDFLLKFVDFLGVDGTLEKSQRRSQFFDAATTNEIPIGRTTADGTGQSFFEMQTGLEAPGLGCGQKIGTRTPDCFLVVVPRSLTEVNGATVGTRTDDWLTTSPLSTTNWVNRITIPLSFRAVGGSCSFGRTETPLFGTDFVTEAVTAWQPVLCGLGPRNYGFSSLSDDTSRQQLASDEPGMAFVTSGVPSVEGVVYAPAAISAMTIVANIDRQMPNKDPNGKPISPDAVPDSIKAKVGSRFDAVKLNQRLLAKLLTQSYAFDIAYGTATNTSKNPFDLSRDPEFLALNPDFKPDGYTALIGNSVGRLFVTAGLSDSADLLWRYIATDQEALDFLAGKPDPWGMVLNEKYKGLTLPTDSFPRADLGCAIPATAQEGFTLPNCTLDVYPYANSFAGAARQVSRGEANRRDVPRLSEVQSYGLSPNQVLGQRSLIGLTDTASAARYSQVTVALKNAAGKYVAPTDASMAAAVSAMGPDKQGVLIPNLTSSNPDAYPLTLVSYAATVPSKLTANERTDYSKLLSYVASSGQVQGTAAGQLPAGYLPLPAALKVQTANAANAIATYVAPTASPTPTDTPTPTPTDEVTPDVPVSGGGVDVPTPAASTPEASPSPSPSTSAPVTTPVSATGPTPADPQSASRLALLAALVLGGAALLVRVVLPWFAAR